MSAGRTPIGDQAEKLAELVARVGSVEGAGLPDRDRDFVLDLGRLLKRRGEQLLLSRGQRDWLNDIEGRLRASEGLTLDALMARIDRQVAAALEAGEEKIGPYWMALARGVEARRRTGGLVLEAEVRGLRHIETLLGQGDGGSDEF